MQHSIEFSLEFSSLGSLEETGILLSSAKRMVWEILFMMHGKLLIYTLNSNGPKAEPWGTPCRTISTLTEDYVNWQIAIQLYYAKKILTNLKYSLLLHEIPTSKSRVHD